MATGYLQHARDWAITKEAIVRLSARLGHPFTYADLAQEIEGHDGLRIDPRGYAGALNAVAGHLRSDEPMWTVMVVNADTGEPGEGFWHADYPDVQYRIVVTLSTSARRTWFAAQQRWCIAAARIAIDPLDQSFRDEEARARIRARESLIDLMLHGRRGADDVAALRRVGLVSCTKSKLDHPAAARDLYMPSALFRGQWAFVEATCDRWFVLSAKYGLLRPDEVIEPYEQTLKTATGAERRAWSERVLTRLVEELGDLRGVTFECHAGSSYLDHGLVQAIEAAGGTVERPTEGLRMGEQLAFYSGRGVPPPEVATPPHPRPDLVHLSVPEPPTGADAERRRAIVEMMLAFGASLDADDLIALGPDPGSDRLLRDDPFAFLLGVIFDQGIRYERAWRAPFELRERIGSLDPTFIVANPDLVREAVARPPALHRYVENVPAWVVAAADRVLTEYGGDAERIWSDRPSAAELQRRLQLFKGIGQKKAAMAVEILERQRGVEVMHLEGSDIAFDVHVRRVFLRTGLAERDQRAHMLNVARELHPARPGALDYPAWWIGHEWCGPVDPSCGACPLAEPCPRLVDHARGVT